MDVSFRSILRTAILCFLDDVMKIFVQDVNQLSLRENCKVCWVFQVTIQLKPTA
ncbi:disease resistance protein RGA3 [Pyrus ussuriensis x Pyrus communis]|uniref:Disease resistance protein RGA3 n=1 Tax=Pyrus ussuriensis x Pyrus communis TaxID=2448454 RepID=A0A5N5HX18_9ROSA|nr:disease resistance protein RGA3 [Pyrus ussuriensis x Pyrus communis]